MSELYNAILKGDLNKAKTLVQQAIDNGETPKSIIDENMIPAMEGSLELLKPLFKAISAKWL